MSGLIWGALGQSVANAGSTIGGMMLRDIEDQRRREEEERREERAVRRMEEADRIKSERERRAAEDLEQRVAREAQDVRTRAEQRGAARREQQLDQDAARMAAASAGAAELGLPAPTASDYKETMKAVPGMREQYGKQGTIAEPMTPAQERLQRASEEAETALEMGAHSSVVKFYEKKRSDVLNEIREENREAEGRRRDARLEAAEERRSREFQALLAIRQQTADAATTRAERPPAGRPSDGEKPITGVDLERTAKAAEKELALALGVPVQQVAETVASRLRKGPLDPKVQSAYDNYNTSLQRWREFRQKPGEAPAAAPAPAPVAGTTRPPLNAFIR